MADNPMRFLAESIVKGDPKLSGRKAEPEMGESNDEDPEAEYESEKLDDGQLTAAEEAMAAMQAGDAVAFGQALKSFLQML